RSHQFLHLHTSDHPNSYTFTLQITPIPAPLHLGSPKFLRLHTSDQSQFLHLHTSGQSQYLHLYTSGYPYLRTSQPQFIPIPEFLQPRSATISVPSGLTLVPI
ncbi:unnamed protein product, partial [Staurois parvus]